MNIYKIQFKDHDAVSSQELDFFNCKSVEIEYKEGKRLLKWITVFADSEQESIIIANKMAKDFFDFLHR